MRDRVKWLGVVPTGADPGETSRLIVECAGGRRHRLPRPQGKLEVRTVNGVEQFCLTGDGMVPSPGGVVPAEDVGVAKRPHPHEGAASVAGLESEVNERPANCTTPHGTWRSARRCAGKVIEAKAADDTTGEGGRRPADLLDVVIDDEFESLLQEPTDEELAQLEANLLATRPASTRLKVWKGHNVLLDGHRRRQILLKHPRLPYKIDEIDLPDREAARAWVLAYQLGRRTCPRRRSATTAASSTSAGNTRGSVPT